MLIKTTILALLGADVKLPEECQVKTIVFQDTVWDGMVECRCFCDTGATYCALFDCDDKITKFVLAPNKPEGK